jgi:hypothetical protein
MPRDIVFTSKAANPSPAYSQAVKAAGLVFVSGTAPTDPATGQIKPTSRPSDSAGVSALDYTEQLRTRRQASADVQDLNRKSCRGGSRYRLDVLITRLLLVHFFGDYIEIVQGRFKIEFVDRRVECIQA